MTQGSADFHLRRVTRVASHCKRDCSQRAFGSRRVIAVVWLKIAPPGVLLLDVMRFTNVLTYLLTYLLT